MTRAIDDAPPCRINWPLVKARCTELGAKTNVEAALLMGMAPRTLDRLRFHQDGNPRLSTLLKARKTLGLSLDDMFPAGEVACDRNAA
jgi:hypothetical protein